MLMESLSAIKQIRYIFGFYVSPHQKQTYFKKFIRADLFISSFLQCVQAW